MFQELQRRLGTIDNVLNEEVMNRLNADDIQMMEFDPLRDYTQLELEQLYCKGIEALKKSGQEAYCILLEVVLEKDGDKYTKLYLRGFESRTNHHPTLASNFLERELRPILSPHFELPEEWPSQEVGGEKVYEKTITYTSNNLRLSISVIGGKKFDLKNTMINLRDFSLSFGHIPLEQRGRLKELLDQLTQKPAYQGFQYKIY